MRAVMFLAMSLDNSIIQIYTLFIIIIWFIYNSVLSVLLLRVYLF